MEFPSLHLFTLYYVGILSLKMSFNKNEILQMSDVLKIGLRYTVFRSVYINLALIKY